MASAPLETTIETGESILAAKRYILAFSFLWFWDYALTFRDEVNYGWKGRKSWAFGLFLLNRYCPLPYLIWGFFASWWPGYSQKACDKTAFIEILFFSFVTLFAQTTLTLRVHAVTGKNRWITAVPGCITLAQFFFGCYTWVEVSNTPANYWSPIPIDSFRLCFFNQKRFQAITNISFSLVYDLLVFLIIVWVGRRARGLGPPGTRTILDKIVRDGTVYFLVIFTSHLIVECFMLFATPTYRLLPAHSNSIFIPLMASRLMLSLKKAADKTGSFACTDDINVDVTEVLFANGHTTMEYALEVGVSRRDGSRDQAEAWDVIALRLVESRPR